MRLKVKDWQEYQHYSDRSPPWIKLHKKILNNYDFQRLPDASRALAPMLWLLASEGENGVFQADMEYLCFRLPAMSKKEIEIALKPLIDKEFFIVESGMLAECKQSSSPRREEKEKRKNIDQSFDAFWQAYPRKVGKGAAKKSYATAVKKMPPDELLEALKKFTFGDDTKFIPHPATWLNQERWADEQTADDKWSQL